LLCLEAVQEEVVDLKEFVRAPATRIARARTRADERREKLERAGDEGEESLRERAEGSRVGRRRLLLLRLLRRPLRRRLGVRVCGGQIGGEGLEVGGEPGVEASPPPASVALNKVCTS
jgi:hypothetical protein